MLSMSFTLSLLIAGGAVSKYQPVIGYFDGKPEKILVFPIVNSGQLQADAAKAFLEMHAAAAKEGIELRVNSSFRTYREQKEQRKRKGELAAKPGFSKHQSGLAVDIANTRRKIKGRWHKTIVYWWLHRNAEKFGFQQTVAYEPWHWEFVGKPNTNQN